MLIVDKVERVYNLYPEVRNCSIKLVARIWSEYYGLDYDKILVVMAEASPETLVRARRKIREIERLEKV